MTPQDPASSEPQRRYATLVAVVLESTATVIDELVDLHDRILVKLFSSAKHKHQQQFQKQGQGDQRQGASVLQDWPGAVGGQGNRQRSLRRHRGGDSLGRVHRERQRGRAAGPAGGLRPSAPGRRELRHPAPLHAGSAGSAGVALRPGRTRRAGGRADPARDECRQPAQGAGRCTHSLHQTALEAAGDHPRRPRPAFL